jgi:hypothetical protein
MLTMLFMPFSFIAPKHFYISWLSTLSIFSYLMVIPETRGGTKFDIYVFMTTFL